MQLLAPSQYRRNLAAMLDELGIDPAVTFNGTNTAGSPVIAGVIPAEAETLRVGATVAGDTVPAGSTITEILFVGPNYSVTISNNITNAHASAVAFTATPVSIAAPMIHLASAVPSPGNEPTPASFTEATFDGYAALPLGAPVGPYSNPDGSAEVDWGDLSWVLTATPTTPNTIYAYWIDYLVDGVRTVLAWEPLPPTPMENAGNAVVLSVPLVLPGPGAATLIN